MRLGQRDPHAPLSSGRDYGTDFHTAFAIKQQRRQFQAQPPQLQREQLARVLRLLEAERRRRQAQPSYLMRYWRRFYRRTEVPDASNA